MLYTVVADYRKLLSEIIDGEGGIASPFSHFPEELKSYIRMPKTEEGKAARLGGYLLLFHTLRFLFGKAEMKIELTERGKPRLSSEELSNISFNISHSGGLCAVTLCDDGGEVGVDIQEQIDSEKTQRVKERFYTGGFFGKELNNTVYLFGGFSAFGDCMFCEIPYSSLRRGAPESDFTDRWSLSEAIMKWDGRGFGAFGEIETLSRDSYFESVKISYKGKKYSLSTVSSKDNEVENE